MNPIYERQNRPIRAVLRKVGWIALPIGVLALLVGIVDFFMAVAHRNSPEYFWCFFMGMPLLFVGLACLQGGYLRTIKGYIAGESVPVVADAAKAVGKQWRAGGNEADAIAGQKGDAAQRMRQLESLKDSGLISQDEYRVKRAEILREL